MLDNEQPRHIDLHLPSGWNRCTTEELEHIASVVVLRTAWQDRYHPFDWDAVKVQLILLINHLEIVEIPAADTDPTEAEYIVRFEQERRSLFQRIRYRLDRLFYSTQAKDDTFSLSVAVVHALISNLSWLDDEKAEPLMRFPYPTLTVGHLTLRGATPLLDGYSWEEYRRLQDWMQDFVQQSNLATRFARKDRIRAFEQAAKADTARAEFLAVLFRHRNQDGDYDAKPFRHFDDIRWQVILFWWTGLMRYLIKTFPRCFKQEKPAGRRPNPWFVYGRTMATIEKYLGGDEKVINAKSYQINLQHLEDMAREAEEMKRINQKYKGKH